MQGSCLDIIWWIFSLSHRLKIIAFQTSAVASRCSGVTRTARQRGKCTWRMTCTRTSHCHVYYQERRTQQTTVSFTSSLLVIVDERKKKRYAKKNRPATWPTISRNVLEERRPVWLRVCVCVTISRPPLCVADGHRRGCNDLENDEPQLHYAACK